MRHIEDNILLAGLVASTVPFEYKDGKVEAQLSIYLTEADLQREKAELEGMRDKAETDELRLELSDEIAFLDRILEALRSK